MLPVSQTSLKESKVSNRKYSLKNKRDLNANIFNESAKV